MSRSPRFDGINRLLRLAMQADVDGRSSTDAVAADRESRRARLSGRASRRQFLAETSRLAAIGAGASALGSVRVLAGQSRASDINVGIVGAGLAGLACANALRDKGVNAVLYDAANRVGGRCWSLRNFFPGQVAERGGEYIDNPHKTLIGYARRFGLTMEDVTKVRGEVFYHFNSQAYAEPEVVDAFREFDAVMRDDLRKLSNESTALDFTAGDAGLDRTSLADYLDGRNAHGEPASALVRAVITEAYEAEYGLEAGSQSCLNFLLFIHADRRSKFTPFGISSDERWHVMEGNDRIASGLAAPLSSRLNFGMTLEAVRATPAGRIELTFTSGTRTITRVHDTVVVTVPFSVLRYVNLHPNLNISPGQQQAIAGLGYGTNAKMMVGFRGRPWIDQGGTGTAYSDLPNFQLVWETNPGAATASRAVLTDYASGARGARLDPALLQSEVGKFLTDLNIVYPGAQSAATIVGNQYLAHLEPWPSNPLARGSYTCYMPGQFTTLAGYEGLSAGPLHFAGEHANSFYVWQGFMEGAALSGIDAAKSVLAMV